MLPHIPSGVAIRLIVVAISALAAWLAPLAGPLAGQMLRESWMADARETAGLTPQVTSLKMPSVSYRAAGAALVLMSLGLFLPSMPTVHAGVWLLLYAILALPLAIAAFADASDRVLPDVLIVPSLLAILLINAYAHTAPWMTLRDSVVSMVLVFVASEAASFVGSLFGAPAGGGDSKLLALIAAWAGWFPTMLVFILAVFSGLITTRILRAVRRDPHARKGFPLGPYLMLAFCALHTVSFGYAWLYRLF